MIYLIANWKAQQTLSQMQEWVDTFSTLLEADEEVSNAIASNKLQIIVCPEYPFILAAKEMLTHSGLHIGAQNVSSKEMGKYTGEVPAEILTDIVDYAIVGHSERRSHFHETDEEIAQKIIQCKQHSLNPVLCIRGESDNIPDGVKIIAYEPVGAIGSGQNEDANLVLEMKDKLKLSEDTIFLYGGSVSKDNIMSYANSGKIDGYLVGTASLDASHFFALAKLLS